jgi:adenosylcobinamide-GDP ribazoletransferase
MGDALRLALTTFTVLPVRAGRVDRTAARGAMLLAPLIGAALGLAAAGASAGLRALGASGLVAAVAAVALLALLTRGMHLDGLADTADGLGSFGDPERALAVMKQPDVGPFGVVTLVLTLLVQVAALADRPPLLALPVAAATGRAAVCWACRRSVPAARPDGLGALVAGTVPVGAAAGWSLVLAAAALVVVPGRAWLGPVAVLAGLGASALLTAHAVRRFGGVTGDVFGAAVEIGTTVCVVLVTLRS